MKVFEDISSNSLVEEDPYLRAEKVNLTPDDFDVSSLSLESYRSNDPASWEKFKKKLQSKIAAGQL
ncbi:hypothetical protein TVAG_286430 [Trichomonas vaginalis G3]|uniref:Uncharacterized protein n=1 Tax=Trichomonas vaginalis (strain ATCC PRA-98 / G3) TaxID=412133 RepID=A2EPF7_TRIV3|nr:hypothetical protein TVAGG3_0616110 [Trichomonas vaginalis G3]EAY05465.1 hypothetical protein TVAG_286430 [Trichomonas vaginalis G3]KAI5503557.1 hypothetical protein TVAGG3_0616110 [Trichomonas vaginalis G3]|eukprot:XP_001317688.1 hypothetical protein [Trichomonas vaginalis G3]